MSLITELKATLASPQTKKVLPYVAAILLLLGTALMVYVAAVSPSKQPYRDALAKYKVVYDANIAVMEAGAAMGATTASDQQFTKNIEKIRTALTTLRSETESLGKQPVLREGEGKALYDAFNEKLRAYLAYNEDILTSVEKLRPILYECNNKSANLTESEESATALHTCVAGLKAVDGVPDADYKAMQTAFITSYSDLEANIAAAAKLSDPKGADKQHATDLEDERSGIISSLTTATRTLAKGLQEHRAEVDITETAKALDDYLAKKASLFSF